jgi:hypothetical protein
LWCYYYELLLLLLQQSKNKLLVVRMLLLQQSKNKLLVVRIVRIITGFVVILPNHTSASLLITSGSQSKPPTSRLIIPTHVLNCLFPTTSKQCPAALLEHDHHSKISLKISRPPFNFKLTNKLEVYASSSNGSRSSMIVGLLVSRLWLEAR